jgi:tetratricopeptide (TPR) repeat protein
MDDSLVLRDITRAKNLVTIDVPGALNLANSALIISRNNNFDRGIAEAYLVAGQCHIQTGDISAQKSLQFALKYAEKVQDKALISDCYFFLGRSCFIINDIKSQLMWYEKAFEIRKGLNDEKRLADIYHAYGNVYLHLKQDSLADSYFNLAKSIRTKLNDMNGLAAVANNLALLAERKGDIVLYRKLLYDAIRMNEETGNNRNLATNHGNLGVSYFKEQKYDSAWHHGTIAFDLRKNNDLKDHLAGTYTDLGNILFAEKKYTEALKYYKEGAKLAESISGNEWMQSNYLSLSKVYAALDSNELSLKYKTLADSLTKEDDANINLSKSIPLPPAFDFVEAQAKTKSTPYWWVIGALIILSVVGFVFFIRRKRKEKNA